MVLFMEKQKQETSSKSNVAIDEVFTYWQSKNKDSYQFDGVQSRTLSVQDSTVIGACDTRLCFNNNSSIPAVPIVTFLQLHDANITGSKLATNVTYVLTLNYFEEKEQDMLQFIRENDQVLADSMWKKIKEDLCIDDGSGRLYMSGQTSNGETTNPVNGQNKATLAWKNITQPLIRRSKITIDDYMQKNQYMKINTGVGDYYVKLTQTRNGYDDYQFGFDNDDSPYLDSKNDFVVKQSNGRPAVFVDRPMPDQPIGHVIQKGELPGEVLTKFTAQKI